MAFTGPTLQSRTILCGRGTRHFHEGAMPLGVRTFWGGTARYRTERGAYAIDEGSWFVVNAGQPYSITIDARHPVESLVVFFPAGWAEDVARHSQATLPTVLDDPTGSPEPVRLFETVTGPESRVLPRLIALHAACRDRGVADGWLEDRLWDLLRALLLQQGDHRDAADRLGATRTATRLELYRRLCRGRDFLRATADSAPLLQDAARVACLSPFHFQRSFSSAFGESPHMLMTRCRLERARARLERTDESATVIAADAGFQSYGAFHRAFVRRFGGPPSRFRKN